VPSLLFSICLCFRLLCAAYGCYFTRTNLTEFRSKSTEIQRKKRSIFIKKKTKTKNSFVILALGAEPSQYSLTEKAPKRKAPSIREPVPKSSNTNADVETEDLYSETASLYGDAQGKPDSTPEAVKNTLPVDPEVHMAESLLARIALSEQQVKIKHDNAAIMFYTGFPVCGLLSNFLPSLLKSADPSVDENI